ncbi:unnamed protein product [Penicillium camemberti]|uniref:Str. FM013 n=1 Tax=Penicillium camemberti (strain FM 013) TaxID=1429867 RepID=A0A0G4NTI5_PENC3|nr:unnamed protein product [Penicillium camemberti]
MQSIARDAIGTMTPVPILKVPLKAPWFTLRFLLGGAGFRAAEGGRHRG